MAKKYNISISETSDFVDYKLFDRPIKPPSNNGFTGKRGQALNREKSIKTSIKRAKNKIRGYILSNNFDYWATQTFNNKKIDRYDLDDIIKKYNKKLKNLKQRKYKKLAWLIVPEQHKDGAWHLHLFMSGIPSENVVYSGYDYYNKKNHYKRRIYNWIDTIDFGFNDYLYIGDCKPLERLKMANYITKYITKDLAQIRFNKKMYWNSRGLALPKKTNTLIKDADAFLSLLKATENVIYENEYYMTDDKGEIFNGVKALTTSSNIITWI